jgi:hypothetical protein
LWKTGTKFDNIVTFVVKAMQLLGYYLTQSVTNSKAFHPKGVTPLCL